MTVPTAAPRAGTEARVQATDISLVRCLETMLAMEASDLHLTVGAPPTVRVAGSLRPIPGAPKLDSPSLQRIMYAILTQQQREVFEERLELDFSYSLPGRARFRVNMYLQRESVGAAFRVIPFEIKNLDSLGIPPIVASFPSLPRGFVLVTGPTGSGKSTTLAALIDIANTRRHDHIMTVEDPIEFLHRHRNCLVNQREVGTDTLSFAEALKHVLRQDPDIILVGEMRDLETIQPRASPPPRPGTSCSPRCTPRTPPRPSTASSTCSRRTSSNRSGSSWQGRCRGSSARPCARPPTAGGGLPPSR